jgi:hypothetical protein
MHEPPKPESPRSLRNKELEDPHFHDEVALPSEEKSGGEGVQPIRRKPPARRWPPPRQHDED